MIKQSIFVLAVILVVSVHLPIFAQDIEDYDHNWMVLSMKLNNTDFSVGDEIIIDLALINFADRPFTFRKDPHRFVVLTSRMGERNPISDGAQVVEGAQVTLKPKEKYQEKLIGKIIEGTGYIAKGRLKREGRSKVEGMFIQFPTYRIFLENGQGGYTLQATYSTGVWHHKSNRRSIIIRK